MTGTFDGKVAIVTGGGSGIGRATAVTLGERGGRVVVGDVDRAGGRETVERIEDGGGTATFVEADVTDEAAVASLVAEAVEGYGRLDCAFNNAGVSGPRQSTHEYSPELWERFLEVNLTGVHRCMRHEIGQFLEQEGGGAIVNTASTYALVGVPKFDGYVSSKHGVLGATRAAALEYATDDIRVNAVCPGGTNTQLLEENLDADGRAALADRHPMKRLGEPEEIAEAVVWLCSDAASFVTGEALAVDGGYTCR